MTFTPTQYQLRTVRTGRLFADDGWTLSDSQCAEPSLIQAVYATEAFQPHDEFDGLYRYADWLPVQRMLTASCAPVTYRSEGLARALGLSNLHITFSGWCPAIGARFRTGTFKETEAYSVLGRLSPTEQRILVVQSAGNTARAFAQVCSDHQIPVVVCIPEDCLGDLWFAAPLHPCVKVVAAPHGADYFDVISIGNKLASDARFLLEGGATNIARRDGMGTTVLSYAEHTHRIPDAYFQAVGSGTGAIAAWENACRLERDGRYGPNHMRVYVAQNSPFTLMHDAWQARSRVLPPLDDATGREQASQLLATVLSNRRPPYSLAGGLFDTLTASHGDTFVATNDDIIYWKQQFARLEGIELHPAACVAVAALAQAVQKGTVKSSEYIMLNCTGGGIEAAQADGCVHKPADLIVSTDIEAAALVQRVLAL